MWTCLFRGRNKRKNGKHNQIPPTPATVSPPSAPPPPPWTELPVEVTVNILQRLGAEEILMSAEKVCTAWNNVCRRDPTMWRVVHLRSNGRDDDRKLGLMCRCAVDRSQGQLADLSIAHFGDNELLNYVALRSSHLRRLKLANSCEITAFALIEAVKKFPQLEELHLLGISLKLGAKDFETIGISCPLLRSYTDNSRSGVALAIAKNMPNLRSLRLYGDVIDKEVLEAILDGCPLLESLDTRYCKDLDDDLKAGALGERCRKQIKDLRLVPYRQRSVQSIDNLDRIDARLQDMLRQWNVRNDRPTQYAMTVERKK